MLYLFHSHRHPQVWIHMFDGTAHKLASKGGEGDDRRWEVGVARSRIFTNLPEFNFQFRAR